MEVVQLGLSTGAAAQQAAAGAPLLLDLALPLWLFPLLLVSGIALELLFLCLHHRLLLGLGAVLVLGAAALDRDLTLAVGQIFVVVGLFSLFDPKQF